MKKQYSKATVEVIEFRAEKGFAASASTQNYTSGGTIDWDPSSSDNNNEGGFSGWTF